ncbi:MAG: NAD(P)/FAD-dependent oxidoreductase [Saprospiraceae bacterium]
MERSRTQLAKPSYWEQDIWYKAYDVVIVGGGLVGLQTAQFLSAANPKLRLAVIDRQFPPLGASTRNAGFACVGSLGELADDVEAIGLEATIDLVARRCEGLRLLRETLGDSTLQYEGVPNVELFRAGEEEVLAKVLGPSHGGAENLLQKVNSALASKLKLEAGPYQLHGPGKMGSGMNYQASITNGLEGQLHPGKMVKALYKLCISRGVSCFSESVIEVNPDGVVVESGRTFNAKEVVVATNGFTQRLLPSSIKPALNQVIVTAPVDGLAWKAPIHLEQGYGYLRRIGDRVLVGGFRNHFKESSETDEFQLDSDLGAHLRAVLVSVLPTDACPRIEYEWSGVLGLGTTRMPHVQRLPSGLVIAAGLGGMGVALGSLLGKEAAQMILQRA